MKNNYPLVSVGIPVYNTVKYIDTTINSVLLQTYKGPINIIIQDDCSSDGTWELVNEKYANSPNIYLFRNEKNLGKGINFNELFKNALKIGCDYFLKLDSDDWIGDTLIEKGVLIFKEDPGLDAVTFSLKYFVEESKIYLNRKIEDSFPEGYVEDLAKLTFFENPFNLNSILFQMKTLCLLTDKSNGNLFIESEVGDYELLLRFAFAGKKMFFTKSAFGFYRRHDSNSSNTPNIHFLSFYFEVMPMFKDEFKTHIGKKYKKRFRHDLFLYIKGIIRKRNPINFKLLYHMIIHSF